MTDKRMSDDAAAMALKLRTHCFAGGRLCADRVVGKCRNCTAADMIDALRAELTAARTVTDGEVAKWINYLHGTDPLPENYDVELDDLLTRLSASYSAACRERDRALAKIADLEHQRLLIIAQGI